MIAEAADYIAARRGFNGGDPTSDWLAAEREINHLLPSPAQQKTELAAYEKLRSELNSMLSAMRGTVTADHLRSAYDVSMGKITDAGGHAADVLTRAGEMIKKDIAIAAMQMGPGWKKFSAQTADIFSVWADRGSAFLGSAEKAVGEWLQKTGSGLEQKLYQSGEVTYGGTLECTACGKRLELGTAAHIPLCPGCRGREFRRVQSP
jgi:predicted RNA-binding Zn-ribbon protein involved in translation (DUF1610 family)